MTALTTRHTNFLNDLFAPTLAPPAADVYYVRLRRTQGRWVQHRQHGWAVDHYRDYAQRAGAAINARTRARMRETSFMRQILTVDLAPGAAGAAYYWYAGPNGAQQCFRIPKLIAAVLTESTAAVLNTRTRQALEDLKSVAWCDVGDGWVLATYDRYWAGKIRERIVARGYQLTPGTGDTRGEKQAK